MLRLLSQSMRVPEIRRKILITAALLAVYRLGSYIPAPGINGQAVKGLQGFSNSGLANLLNLFSGGSLSRFAVFALGIMPYITASIMVQLLTVVSPRLEKLSKEGEVGQQRITQYTRYLTVVLAFLQSIGYVFLFHASSSSQEPLFPTFDIQHIMIVVAALTAGTIFVMWLGELITQRGIGNGISLMIFASIISRIPGGLSTYWHNPDAVFKIGLPFFAVVVVAAVVFVQEGQRRVPIQYARQVVGRRQMGGASTYLPLRVNMAGVIPVIFAASLMAFPATVGQLINTGWSQSIATFFTPTGWHYLVGEAFLIIAFTYFYTAVTFNPVEQADNLNKNGGSIPGISPGLKTAQYLDHILSRLTLPGALFLAAIAALPTILIDHTSANFYFGGTSILIVIGVALDTLRQLEAQMMSRNYEGFLQR
jgi:preprotein translocase subunit SecY